MRRHTDRAVPSDPRLRKVTLDLDTKTVRRSSAQEVAAAAVSPEVDHGGSFSMEELEQAVARMSGEGHVKVSGQGASDKNGTNKGGHRPTVRFKLSPIEVQTGRCTICGATFDPEKNLTAFYRHIKYYHDPTMPNSRFGPTICKVCGESFDNSNYDEALYDHMRVAHRIVPRFHCKFEGCEEAFTVEKFRVLHEVTHAIAEGSVAKEPEGPKKDEGPTSSRLRSRGHSLLKDKKENRGKQTTFFDQNDDEVDIVRKRYRCSYCVQTFKKYAEFQDHCIIKHPKEEFVHSIEYHCTHCAEAFKTSSDMWAHRKATHFSTHEQFESTVAPPPPAVAPPVATGNNILILEAKETIDGTEIVSYSEAASFDEEAPTAPVQYEAPTASVQFEAPTALADFEAPAALMEYGDIAFVDEVMEIQIHDAEALSWEEASLEEAVAMVTHSDSALDDTSLVLTDAEVLFQSSVSSGEGAPPAPPTADQLPNAAAPPPGQVPPLNNIIAYMSAKADTGNPGRWVNPTGSGYKAISIVAPPPPKLPKTVAPKLPAKLRRKTKVAQPKNSGGAEGQMQTEKVTPPDATSKVAPPNATSKVAPLDAISKVAPPDTTPKVAPSSATSKVAPPDTTPKVAPPSATSKVAPLDETSTVAPPGTTRKVAPPEATSKLPPSDGTARVAPSAATPKVAPPEAISKVAPSDGTSKVAPPSAISKVASADATSKVAPPAATSKPAPPHGGSVRYPVVTCDDILVSSSDSEDDVELVDIAESDAESLSCDDSEEEDFLKKCFYSTPPVVPSATATAAVKKGDTAVDRISVAAGAEKPSKLTARARERPTPLPPFKKAFAPPRILRRSKLDPPNSASVLPNSAETVPKAADTEKRNPTVDKENVVTINDTDSSDDDSTVGVARGPTANMKSRDLKSQIVVSDTAVVFTVIVPIPTGAKRDLLISKAKELVNGVREIFESAMATVDLNEVGSTSKLNEVGSIQKRNEVGSTQKPNEVGSTQKPNEVEVVSTQESNEVELDLTQEPNEVGSTPKLNEVGSTRKSKSRSNELRSPSLEIIEPEPKLSVSRSGRVRKLKRFDYPANSPNRGTVPKEPKRKSETAKHCGRPQKETETRVLMVVAEKLDMRELAKRVEWSSPPSGTEPPNAAEPTVVVPPNDAEPMVVAPSTPPNHVEPTVVTPSSVRKSVSRKKRRGRPQKFVFRKRRSTPSSASPKKVSPQVDVVEKPSDNESEPAVVLDLDETVVPKRRGRGRPPKPKVTAEIGSETTTVAKTVANKPKRKGGMRGRPRKVLQLDAQLDVAKQPEADSEPLGTVSATVSSVLNGAEVPTTELEQTVERRSSSKRSSKSKSKSPSKRFSPRKRGSPPKRGYQARRGLPWRRGSPRHVVDAATQFNVAKELELDGNALATVSEPLLNRAETLPNEQELFASETAVSKEPVKVVSQGKRGRKRKVDEALNLELNETLKRMSLDSDSSKDASEALTSVNAAEKMLNETEPSVEPNQAETICDTVQVPNDAEMLTKEPELGETGSENDAEKSREVQSNEKETELVLVGTETEPVQSDEMDEVAETQILPDIEPMETEISEENRTIETEPKRPGSEDFALDTLAETNPKEKQIEPVQSDAVDDFAETEILPETEISEEDGTKGTETERMKPVSEGLMTGTLAETEPSEPEPVHSVEVVEFAETEISEEDGTKGTETERMKPVSEGLMTGTLAETEPSEPEPVQSVEVVEFAEAEILPDISDMESEISEVRPEPDLSDVSVSSTATTVETELVFGEESTDVSMAEADSILPDVSSTESDREDFVGGSEDSDAPFITALETLSLQLEPVMNPVPLPTEPVSITELLAAETVTNPEPVSPPETFPKETDSARSLSLADSVPDVAETVELSTSEVSTHVTLAELRQKLRFPLRIRSRTYVKGPDPFIPSKPCIRITKRKREL